LSNIRKASFLTAVTSVAVSLSACGPDPFLAIRPLAGSPAEKSHSVAYSVADAPRTTTPGGT
jgi:hypothetical protein